MLTLLFACIPSGPPSATSVDSGTVPPSSTPTSTAAVPMACAAVTGTRSVWLVDRADPTQFAKPPDPPSDRELATGLGGPDAAGWIYLLAGSAHGPTLLYRSSDAGCAWSLVGESPGEEGSTLYTSPGSPRVYIKDGPYLYVSSDAGLMFDQVSDATPGGAGPLAIVPGDPDHLWSYDDAQVLESPDGGLSWEPRQPFAGPYERGGPVFDTSVVPPRVAATGHGLWIWNGLDWTERAKGHEAFGLRTWDADGAFSVLAGHGPPEPLHLLQAVGGSPPFVDLGWSPAEDESGRFLRADGGDLTMAGHYAPGGTFVMVHKADGALVRHVAYPALAVAVVGRAAKVHSLREQQDVERAARIVFVRPPRAEAWRMRRSGTTASKACQSAGPGTHADQKGSSSSSARAAPMKR